MRSAERTGARRRPGGRVERPLLLGMLHIGWLFAFSTTLAQEDEPVAVATPSPAQPAPAANLGAREMATPDLFTGALQADIPLPISLGDRGLLPPLTLHYNSRVGDGWAGIGWDLSLPSIALDFTPTNDTPRDRYVYKFAGRQVELTIVGEKEYRAKFEGLFLKFVTAEDDGNVTWTMHNGRGTTFVFGQTIESRAHHRDQPNRTVAWHLSQIVDIHGRGVSMTYRRQGIQLVPESIRYGSPPLLRTLEFAGEARPDVEVSYQTGLRNQLDERVRSISSKVNGVLEGEVTFSYHPDASGVPSRSRLAAVTRRGPSGTEIRLASLTYGDAGSGFNGADPWSGPSLGEHDLSSNCLTADFDGDGRMDFTCAGGGGKWSMNLSKPSGWTNSEWVSGISPRRHVHSDCVAGDFDGNGLSDIACHTYNSSRMWVQFSNSAGWRTVADWAGGPSWTELGNCFVADFTGDASTDLLCQPPQNVETPPESLHDLHLHAANENAFVKVKGLSKENGWRGLKGFARARDKCLLGDFDGNLRVDLACVVEAEEGRGPVWRLALAIGKDWTVVETTGPQAPSNVAERCIAADVNRDSLSDVLCAQSQEGVWEVGLSRKDGTFESASWSGGPKVAGKLYDKCLVGDFNSDRRADLSCVESNQWSSHLSTGSSWVSGAWKSPIPVSETLSRQCIGGNLDGATPASLVCRSQSGHWTHFRSDASWGDRLIAITGSYGGTTSIGYMSSSDTTDTRMPSVDVVSTVEANDGVGGVQRSVMTYRGGRYNARLRSFRGFALASVNRPAASGVDGALSVTYFHQGDTAQWGVESASDILGTLKGKISKTESFTHEGTLLSRLEYDYEHDHEEPFYTPIKESRHFECLGECRRPVRTQFTHDAFGNRTKEIVSADDAEPTSASLIVTRSYINDDKRWLLGKVNSVTSTTGAGELLGESRYYYDSRDCAETLGSADTLTKGDLTGIRRRLNDDQWQDSRFGYDDRGNLVCTRNSRGSQSTLVYDATGEFLLSARNDRQQETKYSYFSVNAESASAGATGLLHTVTDPNSNVSAYAYDDVGRLVRETAPERAPASYTYADSQQPGSPAMQRVQGPKTTTSYLDGFGRPVRTRQTWSNGVQIESAVTLGPLGRVIREQVPRFSGGASVSLANIRFDALGRLVAEERADGSKMTYCYFAGAVLTIDGNGRAKVQINDSFSRPMRLLTLSGKHQHTCAGDYSEKILTERNLIYARTSISYDALGRVRQVTDDAGNIATTVFDLGGRLILARDPDRGPMQYIYDTEGNMISRRDATNREVTYRYDSLNRVEHIESPSAAGPAVTSFTYDSGGASDNVIGRLVVSKTPDAERRYVYNKAGVVGRIDTAVLGTTYPVAHEFDELGRLRQVTYPDGDQVNYTFEGPFLRRVNRGKQTLITFNDQTPLGFPREVVFANGSVSRYTYSEPLNPNCPAPTLRLCSIQTRAENAIVFDYRFGYDGAGHTQLVRDQVRAVVQRYYLDTTNRLMAVAEQSVPGAHWPEISDQPNVEPPPPLGGAATWLPAQPGLTWSQAYTYDRIGNMAWSSDLGSFQYPSSGTYSVRPHSAERIGDQVRAYDDVGALTTAGGVTHATDPEGRTRSYGTAGATTSLGYAADGGVVFAKQIGKPARVLIDGVYSCQSNQCWKTIKVNGQPMAVLYGKHTYLLHANHLGSIEAISNEAGRIVARFRYGPFGELAEAASSVTNLAFPTFGGRESLLAPNLIWLGARHYDTRTKRFITPDPVSVTPTPVTGSPYAYGFHNPQTFADTDGAFPWAVPIIIGAVVGGIHASRHGGDFWDGALRGAVAGAFVSFGGWLAAQPGVSSAGGYFVSAWAGAVSGAVQYEIWGGNGQAMIGGGFAAGAIGHGLMGDGGGIHAFETLGQNGLTGTLDYLTNSGLRQGFYSAAYAVASGEDVGDAFVQGAQLGLVSGAAYTALGHGIGLIGSKGARPQWNASHRLYTYDVKLGDWAGITFGNVASSSQSWQTPYPDDSGITLLDHEASHGPQLFDLGPAYLPAHAAALSIGWVFGDHHGSMNPFEHGGGANTPYR